MEEEEEEEEDEKLSVMPTLTYSNYIVFEKKEAESKQKICAFID